VGQHRFHELHFLDFLVETMPAVRWHPHQVLEEADRLDELPLIRLQHETSPVILLIFFLEESKNAA